MCLHGLTIDGDDFSALPFSRRMWWPMLHLTRLGQEMIARGIPATVAPLVAWSSRVEFVAGVALAVGLRQRLAGLALAAFMVPATWVLHPYWIYFPKSELQVQLINACKNLAIIGGLIFIASTADHSRRMRAESRAQSAEA